MSTDEHFHARPTWMGSEQTYCTLLNSTLTTSFGSHIVGSPREPPARQLSPWSPAATRSHNSCESHSRLCDEAGHAVSDSLTRPLLSVGWIGLCQVIVWIFANMADVSQSEGSVFGAPLWLALTNQVDRRRKARDDGAACVMGESMITQLGEDCS